MIRVVSIYPIIAAFLLSTISCGLSSRRAFDRGTKLYEKGQYAESSIEFRKAIQKDPKLGEAYLKLGLAELKQGRTETAAAVLNQAMLLMPDRAEPKSELAQLYIQSFIADPRRPAGYYEKASQLTNELLQKDPGSFAGLRLKGYLAIADNKPPEAVENFRRANQIKPDQPEVITLLVQNLFRDGQAQAAEALASHFLAKRKDYGPLYDILYSHWIEVKRPADAEHVLQLQIANNPRNSLFVTQLARHYYNLGQHEQMTALLEKLTSRPQDFSNAYLDAGNFYVAIGDAPRAIQQYEAGMKAGSSNKLDYQERLAAVLLSAGKRNEAEAILDDILKDHPEDNAARSSRGALRVAKGTPADLDQAIADFKFIGEKEPGNVTYAYQLGKAYELKGMEEAAKAKYLAVLQMRPGDIPTLDALSHLYLREQRFQDAKRYSDMWLAIDARNPSARLVRSASLAGLGDVDQTRAVLKSLIQDYPKLEAAYLQLGLLSMLEKRYDEAEDLLRKHYQPGSGDFGPLKAIIDIYLKKNQFEKALAITQQELGKFPQSAELLQLLGETAARAGRYDLAIEQYRKLRQLQPQSLNVAVQLGLLLAAHGQFDQALSQFQAARGINASDPLVPALTARVLEQAGRRKEAIAGYRESLRLDPENASVMNNLAYALSQTGDDAGEALEIARSALRKNPGNPDFIDTLGCIYLKKKDLPNALNVFQSLRQKQPENATYRLHLAMALLEQGDVSTAQRELLAARELHPSDQELVQIQQLLAQM